jgi:hypothetical protein
MLVSTVNRTKPDQCLPYQRIHEGKWQDTNMNLPAACSWPLACELGQKQRLVHHCSVLTPDDWCCVRLLPCCYRLLPCRQLQPAAAEIFAIMCSCDESEHIRFCKKLILSPFLEAVHRRTQTMAILL